MKLTAALLATLCAGASADSASFEAAKAKAAPLPVVKDLADQIQALKSKVGSAKGLLGRDVAAFKEFGKAFFLAEGEPVVAGTEASRRQMVEVDSCSPDDNLAAMALFNLDCAAIVANNACLAMAGLPAFMCGASCAYTDCTDASWTSGYGGGPVAKGADNDAGAVAVAGATCGALSDIGHCGKSPVYNAFCPATCGPTGLAHYWEYCSTGQSTCFYNMFSDGGRFGNATAPFNQAAMRSNMAGCHGSPADIYGTGNSFCTPAMENKYRGAAKYQDEVASMFLFGNSCANVAAFDTNADGTPDGCDAFGGLPTWFCPQNCPQTATSPGNVTVPMEDQDDITLMIYGAKCNQVPAATGCQYPAFVSACPATCEAYTTPSQGNLPFFSVCNGGRELCASVCTTQSDCDHAAGGQFATAADCVEWCNTKPVSDLVTMGYVACGDDIDEWGPSQAVVHEITDEYCSPFNSTLHPSKSMSESLCTNLNAADAGFQDWADYAEGKQTPADHLPAVVHFDFSATCMAACDFSAVAAAEDVCHAKKADICEAAMHVIAHHEDHSEEEHEDYFPACMDDCATADIAAAAAALTSYGCDFLTAHLEEVAARLGDELMDAASPAATATVAAGLCAAALAA